MIIQYINALDRGTSGALFSATSTLTMVINAPKTITFIPYNTLAYNTVKTFKLSKCEI